MFKSNDCDRSRLKASLLLAIFSLSLTACQKASFSPISSDSKNSGLDMTPPATDGSLPNAGPAINDNYSLNVSANPLYVVPGQSTTFTINQHNLTNISYNCLNDAMQSVAASSLDASHSSLSLTVNENLNCTFTGVNSNVANFVPITVKILITASCGNKINNNGVCEDFKCKSLVMLTSVQELSNVPARTAAGICYAYKIIDGISSGPSGMTTLFDPELVSRNHDQVYNDPVRIRHPYKMGAFLNQFRLLGPRVVKLSGNANSNKPILVDNFVLTGVYPTASGAPPDLTKAYSVSGTSDSSIANAQGRDTQSIKFRNQLIPVIAFATGGTSSVAPIDISVLAQPNVYQTLDVRALDCGAHRNLSDLYILFQ